MRPVSTGATARSRTGLSSSWSRTFSTWYPSSWRSDARTVAFSSTWLSTVQITRPMAAAMRTSPSASMIPSDLDLDGPHHPCEPDDHHHDPRAEHRLTDRLGEQDLHVLGVHHVHDACHRRRQDAEDDRADL